MKILRVGFQHNLTKEFIVYIERLIYDRFVSQAVSRCLPTAAGVRVRAARGVCGGQRGTGAGFLRVLWFLLSIIPSISPSS
jgi:hypothetical protein